MARESSLTTWLRILLYLQAFLYLLAGILHFLERAKIATVVPAHWGHPLFWVALTGVCEIAGALGLCLPWTRRAAAWGLLALLTVYLDVHVNMALRPERFAPLSPLVLDARLLLQFALMAGMAPYIRGRCVVRPVSGYGSAASPISGG